MPALVYLHCTSNCMIKKDDYVCMRTVGTVGEGITCMLSRCDNGSSPLFVLCVGNVCTHGYVCCIVLYVHVHVHIHVYDVNS